MTTEKYGAIWETYQNGNISDARELVQKLKKVQIVELIEYVYTHEVNQVYKITSIIKNLLSN